MGMILYLVMIEQKAEQEPVRHQAIGWFPAGTVPNRPTEMLNDLASSCTVKIKYGLLIHKVLDYDMDNLRRIAGIEVLK